MSTMTFVNLPVKDLARSKEFFTSLGFGFNEQFGDDNTACLVISDLAFVMLHVEPTFAQFTQQEIVDTSQSREVLVGLSADSRGEVDALVDKAVAGGGRMLGAGPRRAPVVLDLHGPVRRPRRLTVSKTSWQQSPCPLSSWWPTSWPADAWASRAPALPARPAA